MSDYSPVFYDGCTLKCCFVETFVVSMMIYGKTEEHVVNILADSQRFLA